MVTENKFLRYTLERSIGKDAAAKFLEILAATGTLLTESGGTELTMGAVSDGTFLKRSGATLIGAAAGGLTATAVKTGDYQAVAGDLVLVDASGGNVVVTSPAAPSAGDKFGVYATAAPGANAVSITATVDNATHDKKLYVVGDLLTFQYDATLTAWVTTEEKLTPHCCLVTMAAAITTNTAATAKVITFDTETYDVGGIFASNKATIRRAGKYRLTLSARGETAIVIGKYYKAFIRQDGTTSLALDRFWNASPTTGATNYNCRASVTVQLAAAAYIEGVFTAEDANMGCAKEIDDTYLVVEELR